MVFNSKKINPSNRDKYFFHDVINQTHGLVLFLSEKINQKNGLAFDETQIVLNEIKALQAILKNHYQMNHKNLQRESDFINVQMALDSLNGMMETFLSDCQLDIKIKNISEIDFYNNKINFPVFYRVMGNIVKNIHEANARFVAIEIETINHQLKLTITNDRKSKFDGDNIVEIMSRNSDGIGPREKLGLDSIHDLLNEIGGHFEFHLEGNQWQSIVHFPMDQVDPIKKAA